MKRIEKIEEIAKKRGYNLATNLGLNEMMKLILSQLDDEAIQGFYIDTFMMFDDEVDALYIKEIDRDLTDYELRINAEEDSFNYKRDGGNDD